MTALTGSPGEYSSPQNGGWNHQQGSYQEIQLLERGAFGRVMLAKHTQSGEEVAIKYIDRGDKSFDRRGKRELKANCRLRHPHVARFRNLFLTETELATLLNAHQRAICTVMQAIVLEFCNYKDMHDYIANNGPLPEAEARHFLQQLILAVSYTHSRGIVSRDIKPANALLHKTDNTILLKLTDFGLARTNDSILFHYPKSAVGTLNFAAPEVIQPGEEGYKGEWADAWSCGAFLYTMVFAGYPFSRADDPPGRKGVERALRRTIDCDFHIPDSPVVSEDCKDLLRRLFVRDPRQRATIDDIMRHPFFLQNLPDGALQLNPHILHEQTTEEAQANAAHVLRCVEDMWDIARLDPSASPNSQQTGFDDYFQ